jgi:hypothetical protein
MTHPAIAFLKLLDPSSDARFNVETFADVAKGVVRPKHDPLLRRHPDLTASDVEALIPALTKLNEKGAAVYIAVNQFRGQRKKKNLAYVRGVHADLDDVTEEQLTALRNTLEPTIVVQSSSAAKQHWYWLLSGDNEMSCDVAVSINRGLVSMGADKAAIDITRLLRLPGFRHMKNFAGGHVNA